MKTPPKPSAQPPKPTLDEPQLTVNTASRDYLVLVVDKDPLARQVLLNQLKAQHYQVKSVPNSTEALNWLADNSPDLVILEVAISPLSGHDLCREIRRKHPITELPVIILTSQNHLSDLIASFQAGANDYITKPYLLTELLIRMRTHLQIAQTRQANPARDRFFSIIAHDLKGPFMPLLGTLELLGEMADFLKPDEIREMGQSMHRSAKDIFVLLENMLQWTRLQMGRLKYEPDKIDLSELVERSVGVWQEAATKKNITLLNRVQQTIYVQADEVLLDSILRNLVSNAVKFTNPDGRVTITYQAVKPIAEVGDSSLSMPLEVEVIIADTGVGLKPDDLAKLFNMETHHTTLGTGKERGTGLGLIMCHELVRKHGGRIWAESEWGEGSTFHFTMPLSPEQAAITAPLLSNEVEVIAPITTPSAPTAPDPKMIIPSRPRISALIQLAQIGDMIGTEDRAREILKFGEQYAPFVNRVIQLSRQFEEEELLNFLKQHWG